MTHRDEPATPAPGPDARTQVYIVRIWTCEAPPAAFRASARRVQSEEVFFFSDVSALASFLAGPAPTQEEAR